MKKMIGKLWLLLLLFLIVGSFIGCGVKERVAEIADEIIDEEVPEANETQDFDDEEVAEEQILEEYSEESIEELMEEAEEVPWASGIPDIFVEFKEGYCIICDNFKEGDSDIWMLTYIDVDLTDVADYNDKLEKKNWILEDEVSDLMYAFTKEDYETIVTISSNEEGEIWYILYLSYEPSNESGSDLNHMDGGSIPEGYPGDIPVYESGTSIIIGATEINAGGSMVYSIEIGCDETTEEIVEVIYPYLTELDKDKATKIIMNGNGMLQGGTDEWHYTIRIEAVEHNGKATNILYQVTPIAN